MNIRENLEQLEQDNLSPYAAHSRDSRGRLHPEEQCDIRPVYQRDRDRILHCKAFRRLKDKTQVFLSPEGDHYRTRLTHTLEVSQNARTIVKALRMNEDLVEAIALGHDLGHTPFGHAGERFLNELYHAHTGRFFNHNVHSVRVLDKLVSRNMSLQVLDGVLCHNGEMELERYQPVKLTDFQQFDKRVEDCYTDPEANKQQIPSTLEGCVMRISDIIAYLGKDRQDAVKVGILKDEGQFTGGKIGTTNAEIINNMIVNIIENSYGKPYLCMEKDYYDAFSKAKKENYQQIYQNSLVDGVYQQIQPMFEQMYEELLRQAHSMEKNSILYRHHIQYLEEINYNSDFIDDYMEKEQPDQIVVDYIASMTDNYFLALYHELFPNSKNSVVFNGYFE